MTMTGILTAAVLACAVTHALADCPMNGAASDFSGVEEAATEIVDDLKAAITGTSDIQLGVPSYHYPGEALPPLTPELYDQITSDIDSMLRTSKGFWPADFGYYGGLMIRMAWHCSGTYRESDGRGGCDGARQRFPPEFHWKDNTNIDKAHDLLEPLHAKYADVISWGDLMILTGNRAIASAGGPILGFCGGRVDEADGTASLPLGPSTEQKQIAPCPENGKCESPLGQSTLGLIYVNPGGPVDAPYDPKASAKDIRYIFGNMGFNDRESVAIIGGGHEFGKAHGACPDGPGPGPDESPSNPYPGLCKKYKNEPRGAGNNTWTNGFEGAWTTKPTQWTNEYFNNLLNYRWELTDSPGGKKQFIPFDKETGEPGPEGIMMLTTDVAFIEDPEYKKLIEEYAADITALERDFAATWYRLTSQDMGPAARCTGPDVPPPQPFQDPLPKSSGAPTADDLGPVSDAVKKLVSDNGKARGLIADLAYNCASTFRTTDHFGGCNGGRIRFSPQIDWPSNKGAKEALKLLTPIHKKNSEHITWADLIVYAGSIAVEEAGGPGIPFCGGRVDAEPGAQATTADLSPRTYYPDPLVAAWDRMKVSGVSAAGYVASFARPTKESPTLSNEIFQTLVNNEWEPVLKRNQEKVDPISGMYKSAKGNVKIPVATWALLRDPELMFYVREYASNLNSLKAAFGDMWVYMMNADRFDGPTGNVCKTEQ